MNIPETSSETRRQHGLLEALTNVLQQDQRVLACWLEGSLARPTEADRHSDIDLHLLVKPEAEQAFRADLDEILSSIRPVLYYRPLPYGSMTAMVLFEDLLQLEVWVEAGHHQVIPAGRSLVLCDSASALSTQTPPSMPSAEIDDLLNLRIKDLWFGVSSVPKVARGELIPMIGHLGRQAEWLTEVILLGRGMTQNVGGSRVTAALTDDEKSAIASVLTVRELTSSSAVAAHLALADLLQSYGRTAAAQRGLEYPEHLERAVLGGVRAELDRLGLSWPERRST